MDIHEEITIFAKREREEAKNAKESEEKVVCVDPDSYIAKEIRKSEVNIVKAKIVKLIRTETSEGKGTEKDPARIVVRYWDKKGKMIFKEDPAMGKGET